MSKDIANTDPESISITKNPELSVNQLVDIGLPVGAATSRSAGSQQHPADNQSSVVTEATNLSAAERTTDSPNPQLSTHDTLSRRPGRPTKAEGLQRKHRSDSAGNITDLLKRKRGQLEHDLMDKILASSPFKKCAKTQRSPPKDASNAEQKANSEPNVMHITKDQIAESSSTVNAQGSQNSVESQSEEISLLDYMKRIVAELSEMKKENKDHAMTVQKNLADSKRENTIFLEQFKKEIRDDLEKNTQQQSNSLKEVKDGFTRKLTALELKITELNPKGELEALNSRIKKLEDKPTNNPAPNEELLSELSNLKKKTERQEKELKRNNIVIKGVQLARTPALEDVEAFLHEEFGVVNAVADVRVVGGKDKILFVKLNNGNVKEEIMKRKSSLGERKIYIDHERTAAEMAIQNSLRAEARALKEKGKIVKIKYQKLIVDGEQYDWKRDKGKLEPSKKVSKEKSPSKELNAAEGTSQSEPKN